MARKSDMCLNKEQVRKLCDLLENGHIEILIFNDNSSLEGDGREDFESVSSVEVLKLALDSLEVL